MSAKKIEKALRQKSSKEKSKILARFFKTDKGQYGYGDRFLGITVPDIRKTVKDFRDKVDLDEISLLIRSPWHEIRLAGFLLLVDFYQNTKDRQNKERFKNFYLANISFVNNWDLVDLTAPKILGDFLFFNKKHCGKILDKLSSSKNLWHRRIAVLTTLAFIREKDFLMTFNLAKKMKNDREDLIHKALGWMLREVGKRDEPALVVFLKKYHEQLPRTTVRYAIERLVSKDKSFFLKR